MEEKRLMPSAFPGNGRSTPAIEGSEFLRRLVAECVERYEEEGEGAVDALCGKHPEQADALRRRVAILGRMGLLETGSAAEGRPLPERLGDFRLLRKLGGGGMGVVYLAEQEPLGRRVALKLVRPEQLFFLGARKRFRREAEAAARLQHPGIVPVYTVGEETGIPYFAMELVEGCTMAEVIRTLNGRGSEILSGKDLAQAIARCTPGAAEISSDAAEGHIFSGTWMEACFRMVRQAAEALNHAHRRGVIHRDVKPSNLMVTPNGRVMLLDFGLAQAEGMTRLTRTGSQLGSLPYMSPEQVRGEAAGPDVRIDIYSLGITLYELLTLRMPYSASSTEAMRQRILEGRPEPVRRYAPSIPRDAETVCLTAMEADPARRYGSAADMTRDLGCVLERRPIEARRPGIGLRARRWVQRHPAVMLALVLGTVLAVGGPTMFALQEHAAKQRVEAERDEAIAQGIRAERNFGKAIEAVDQMLTRVGERRLAFEPRMDSLARELLEDALAFHQDFLSENRDDPRARYETGQAFIRVGRIQRLLGRFEQSIKAVREGVGLMNALDEDFPSNPKYRASLACAQLDLGFSLSESERLEEGTSAFRKAVALYSELDASEPGQYEYMKMLAVAYNGLGTVLEKQQKLDEAENEYGMALEIQARISGPEAQAKDLYLFASYQRNLGVLCQRRGQFQQAGVPLRRAVELLGPLVAEHPRRTDFRLELARANIGLGITLEQQQRSAEALPFHEKARHHLDKLIGEHPKRPDYKKALATNLVNHGKALKAVGRLAEAVETLQSAVQVQEELPEEFTTLSVHQKRLAALYADLGGALDSAGRRGEAEAAYCQALCWQRKLVAESPGDVDYRYGLACKHNTLAWILECLGRTEEAEAQYLEALAVLEELVGETPGHPFLRRELAYILCNLGLLQGSEVNLLRAHSILKDLAARFSDQPLFLAVPADSHEIRGVLYRERGEHADAERALRKALVLREALMEQFPDRPDFRSDLGRTLGNFADLCLERRPKDLREAREKIMRAIRLQHVALDKDPRFPPYQLNLRDHLLVFCETLIESGEHGEAAKAAEDLAGLLPESPLESRRAACIMARCARAAERDPSISGADRKAPVQEYIQRAMELLEEAVRRGYQDLNDLRVNPEYESLRPLENFQQILRELSAGAADITCAGQEG